MNRYFQTSTENANQLIAQGFTELPNQAERRKIIFGHNEPLSLLVDNAKQTFWVIDNSELMTAKIIAKERDNQSINFLNNLN